METVEVVIKIPEELYQDIKENGLCGYCSDREIVSKAIANGNVLPKGHGRLIDADAVNVNETIGGKNEFADCIREAVQTTLDNAPTVIEADKEE